MAVSMKTNKIDPRNPPKIVIGCEDANKGFAHCIPLKVKRANIEATGNELLSVKGILIQLNLSSFTYCLSFSRIFHKCLC